MTPHTSSPRRRARNPSRSDTDDTLTNRTRQIRKRKIDAAGVVGKRGGRRVRGTLMTSLNGAKRRKEGGGLVNLSLSLRKKGRRGGEDILRGRDRNLDLPCHPRPGSRRKSLEWLVNLPWRISKLNQTMMGIWSDLPFPLSTRIKQDDRRTSHPFFINDSELMIQIQRHVTRRSSSNGSIRS